MPEKHHRHHHHKKHKHEHVEAASTDMADLGSAVGASQQQRGEDDEMGSPGVSNANADIIAIMDQSNPTACQIIMNKGRDAGVQLGQDGYVKDGKGGVLARFTIDEIYDGTSRAWVDMPYSVVQHHMEVVIGPS